MAFISSKEESCFREKQPVLQSVLRSLNLCREIQYCYLISCLENLSVFHCNELTSNTNIDLL